MIHRLILLPVALVAMMIVATGCAGLKMWEKGRYFHTEVKPDIQTDQIQTVGVYVFSDGETVDGSEVPFDAFDLIGDILMLPLKLFSGNLSFGGPQIGLSTKFFPSEVRAGASFEPDTTNAGPSLEFATAIQEHLKEFGYSSQVVTDLGHSREISVENCIDHARKAGYDAAFIVHYTGLKSWTEYAGTEVSHGYRTTIVTTKVNVHTGYLYIPNAAFFETKSGQRLWGTTNYGIVENAHIPNLSGEPFIRVESKALINNGGDDYFKAAPKAASMMFSPEMWKQSFKEFPARGAKQQKM